MFTSSEVPLSVPVGGDSWQANTFTGSTACICTEGIGFMCNSCSKEIHHLRRVDQGVGEEQREKMAGLCFVIQKASSALTSNMIELTFIFLLFVPEHALCFPVTTGGNGPVRMFYCKGCATDVTKVFCNDERLFDHSDDDIPSCSGPPQPNSVCQCDGWVFVSTSTDGDCQFEGEKYIVTETCTDLNNTCVFNDPTSSSPVSPGGPQEAVEDHTNYTVIAVVVGLVLLLLVLGVIACFYKKRPTREPHQQQQSDTGETDALKMGQISGDIIERAPPAGPGLDDDTCRCTSPPIICIKYFNGSNPKSPADNTSSI